MPSGYTALFEKRDDVTFEEFVWKCARAMGAFIHMRDDSSDAKIRMPGTDDTYHKDNLKKAVDSLAEHSTMSLERAQTRMNKEYTAMEKHAREAMKEHAVLRKRYTKMLNQVNAWNTPTPEHDGFKKFMVDQLTQSIEWDCNDKYYLEQLESPRQSAKEWLNDQIAEAKHDIEYHTKHLVDQTKHEKSRIDWINALIKSVPMPK
jgi:chaperonin cofactor prefoldin